MYEQGIQVTLVYHNFRGMAQSIRYVLFYLNIPFTEILLKVGQSATSKSQFLRSKLKQQPDLPCLIVNNVIIQECFAAINHICTLAKRQDLLGQTLQQKAMIREVFYNFILKKKKAIHLLFKFGEAVAQNPSKKQEIRRDAMIKSHLYSGSVVQLAQMKLRSRCQKYIFDHITILDFLFYEECFYQINLFGNMEECNLSLVEKLKSFLFTEESNNKNSTSLLLKIMREYKQTFEAQRFYINNQSKIESYSVVCEAMSENSKNAFKQVWLGSKHLLN